MNFLICFLAFIQFILICALLASEVFYLRGNSEHGTKAAYFLLSLWSVLALCFMVTMAGFSFQVSPTYTWWVRYPLVAVIFGLTTVAILKSYKRADCVICGIDYEVASGEKRA